MKYCRKCLYPECSAIPLTFDDNGICSGCRISEEKKKIDWEERAKLLEKVFDRYRSKDGSNYDCIIPVSGGKDSHFQTYIVKEVYGMNPLLVTYNHQFNTAKGIRNLTNMVVKFGCDHVRFTPNPQLLPRLMRVSLEKMGDPCWHCHAGIFTFPVQVAVKFNIPLIVWGEQVFMELGGMYSHNDMVEMTRKFRREHGMRGYDAEDMVDEKENIRLSDLKWGIYPSDEEIERVGVRGIYLNNFIPWDPKAQTELMIKEYEFETSKQPRSFNCYDNVECPHCNGMHDYLKWLKFGYGRGTDHSVDLIRSGRMKRKTGIEMVRKYDSERPKDLDRLLKFMGVSEEQFVKSVENMRHPKAWKKNASGEWEQTDTVMNHDEECVPETVEKEEKEFILTKNKPRKIKGYIVM